MIQFNEYFEFIPAGTCFTGAEIAIAGLVASAVGTGVNLIGSMQQSSANQATANYQAQVARNNQIIAEQNAAYSRQAGAAETETQGFKTASLVGGELAAQGASGVDPTTGSPIDVVRGSREYGRLDTLNLVRNAELRARGFDIAASNEGASAGLFTQQGKNAGTAGLYSAGSSILGGASNFSDKWLKFQNEGVFT
jgi:hypothetical protein